MMGAGSAVRSGRRARRQADRVAEVAAVALTDSLTGVLNRRGFIESAERELDRAGRHKRPFVLAYIDVRGLKGVNDGDGHLVGDLLLKAATTILSESVRAHDVVGRLGGDEFGLLLTEQTALDADHVSERISEQVANRRTELGFAAHWDLTVGLASFPADGSTIEELLAVADRRLYEQRGIALTGRR
jgi:diguanylate cyclase (GGDEF)-like protein